MANSRDFTGKNRKFTGTKGIITPKGTTGQRVGSESGELRFNTTTELMEYYDGNQWKPIDAPPTISSITTSDATGSNTVLNADGSTLFTITISGGNFGIGAVVKFIGNTGTEYAALNVNRVSGSSITCTTRSNMGTTDDPYDVQVTNASGLSALLEDAFSFNAPPVFTNASGTIGEVYNGQVISGTTLNAGATDAEGNTITFTIISGSLPGSGLTISSSTGAITGTLGGTPSLGNYPFVVRASTTEGVVERQFSLQVVSNPILNSTGGTITTSGGYRIHQFTSSSNFVIPANASADVEYLIVAGGGAGGDFFNGGGYNAAGGGGGAGGMLTGTENSKGAGTYPVVVGIAGVSTASSNTSGGFSSSGGQSSVFGLTATGGGRGGAGNADASGNAYAAASGGSGGGGVRDTYTSGAAGTAGQGNSGANYSSSDGTGGGGGGKSSAGSIGSSGGNGGNGTSSSITGSAVTYAIGGGGGQGADGQMAANNGGSGGLGGDGGTRNSNNLEKGGNATAANYGSGGGGAGAATGTGYFKPGGNATPGIVVVRYLIP